MYLKNVKRKLLLLIIIVITSFSLNRADNKIYPVPEGVSIYRLDNGLKVLLIEKPSMPMVGINTLVKIGSAYENFNTSGMSHMLEHLLFNGTTGMTQKELYDSTDIIGGYNNAHTGEYFTNFMMVTPAENIVDGMKIQSAMLFESIIPKDKFEKEKGIVLEEIAKSLSKPNEQMERNTLSIIYDGHALSLPTLGTYSTIENMDRDDVFSFYKKYYVPNNMMISVIGNFITSEMLETIKNIYGKIGPGTINYDKSSDLAIGFMNQIENHDNKIFHRFYNGEKTLLQMFFKIDGDTTTEFLDLLKLSLDKNSKSLKSKLSSDFPDAIEGIEFSVRESPIVNYLQATIILKNDDQLEKLKKYFLTILKDTKLDIAAETIANESIKARTRFLKNTEKPHMFGIYNAEILAEKGIEAILSSYTGGGFTEAYENLTKFSLPENHLTIVQNPSKIFNSETTSRAQSKSDFKNIENGPVIISKQSEEGGLLAIHYLIKNKALLENKYGQDAAKVWHAAFGERMNSPKIQGTGSKYGFTFTVNDNPYIPMDNIYLDPEFGYIRVEALSDSIDSAIRFLKEQMLNFIPTETEFEASKENTNMPSMMGHGNMAKKIFDAKLNAILYEDKKFSKDSPELNYTNLLEFGKEYFVPSNMIISVVSPGNSDQIYEFFNDFAKTSTYKNNELGYKKGFKELSTPQRIDMEGGGEQSYLYYGFQKDIQKKEKPTLQVLSLILSDNIIFDIREKQGLAYSMSAGINIKKNKAMFYIQMGTRPENVDKLIQQFPNFFTADFSNIVDNKLVKKAINMYLGKMMFRRLSSINQAYYLGYSKYFYDDIYHDTKSLNQLKNVNADDIRDLISKYMVVQNPIELYVR